MNNVIHFQPKSRLNAKANLVDFVEFAKGLKPLGMDQPFDSNAWSARKAVNLRQDGTERRFAFTQLLEDDGTLQIGRHSKSSSRFMEEPFLSFAKAMICYSYAVAPRSSIGQSFLALKHLYVALLRTTGSLCPSAITPTVLDAACQLLTDRYKEPYNTGLALKVIYTMMVESGLVAIPTVWKLCIPRPLYNSKRSGKEFDAIRNKKLPSPEALDALAYIFNHPMHNGDIVVTSICALLLCDPNRIIEVISGPMDCIAKEDVDVLGNPLPGICLRWYPAKAGMPMLKPVIPSMVDVAKRAISQLRTLGEPARELARWYELNRTKIYLPSHLEHLRSKQLLSANDLNAILFDGKRSLANVFVWLKANLPECKTRYKSKRPSDEPKIPFADVQKVILNMLPVGFPVLNPTTGVKFSEALCICRLAELSDAAPYQCVLQPINYGQMAHRLVRNGTKPSIFDKHGLTDEIGGPLLIRSHMFRHYLTMVGKAGGLSDIESNKWAGRANASHMRTYDSRSDRDVLANIRDAVALNKPELGPLANMDTRMFINRAEFANIRVISAHTTELGHCLHDYATLPCQLHGDHINCNEHVVIKGEVEQEKNLRCEQVETCSLLEKAKTAMSEEEFGASMWVNDHNLKLERINQIIRLLDDPNTPDGAVIQPSGIVPPSRLKQAMENRLLASGAPLFGGSIRSISDVHTILGNQISAVGGAHG